MDLVGERSGIGGGLVAMVEQGSRCLAPKLSVHRARSSPSQIEAGFRNAIVRRTGL